MQTKLVLKQSVVVSTGKLHYLTFLSFEGKTILLSHRKLKLFNTVEIEAEKSRYYLL